MGGSTLKIAPGVWVHVHFKSLENPNPLQGVPCVFEERYLGFSGEDQPSIPQHTPRFEKNPDMLLLKQILYDLERYYSTGFRTFRYRRSYSICSMIIRGFNQKTAFFVVSTV